MRFSDQKILIIAAHPDDEILGCGGTIKKLVDSNSLVKIMFLTDGVSARDTSVCTQQEVEFRKECAKKACSILGVNDIQFGKFDDNQLDKYSLLEIVKEIESNIKTFMPDIIFTHHVGDLNIDHKIVNQAVVTASRPQNKCSVKSLLFFETLSSTEWQIPDYVTSFSPNMFVDISDYLETKVKAMECYHQELREWPHPRSVKGINTLAFLRGSTAGVNAAEAFIIGRYIS